MGDPTTSSITDSSASTMAIEPIPSGSVPTARPRAATMRNASAAARTPAVTAAAYSPSECPATAAGSTPQLRHSSASAIWNATNAVELTSGREKSADAAPYSTSINETPVSAQNVGSSRVMASRKTGASSYSVRPMPTYAPPCPVNTKATSALLPTTASAAITVARSTCSLRAGPSACSSRDNAICAAAASGDSTTARLPVSCDRPADAASHTSGQAADVLRSR